MTFTNVGKSCPSREFLLFPKINFRIYSTYAMPWCLHLVDADTKAWHKLGRAEVYSALIEDSKGSSQHMWSVSFKLPKHVH